MKVKIFSVRFYGDWKPFVVGELYSKIEEEKGIGVPAHGPKWEIEKSVVIFYNEEEQN